MCAPTEQRKLTSVSVMIRFVCSVDDVLRSDTSDVRSWKSLGTFCQTKRCVHGFDAVLCSDLPLRQQVGHLVKKKSEISRLVILLVLSTRPHIASFSALAWVVRRCPLLRSLLACLAALCGLTKHLVLLKCKCPQTTCGRATTLLQTLIRSVAHRWQR